MGGRSICFAEAAKFIPLPEGELPHIFTECGDPDKAGESKTAVIDCNGRVNQKRETPVRSHSKNPNHFQRLKNARQLHG